MIEGFRGLVKSFDDYGIRLTCDDCGGPPTVTEILAILMVNMKSSVRLEPIEQSNKKAFKKYI